MKDDYVVFYLNEEDDPMHFRVEASDIDTALEIFRLEFGKEVFVTMIQTI